MNMNKTKITVISLLVSCATLVPIGSMLLNRPKQVSVNFTELTNSAVSSVRIATHDQGTTTVDIPAVIVTGTIKKHELPTAVVKKDQTEKCWIHELEGGSGGTVLICDSRERTPINQ